MTDQAGEALAGGGRTEVRLRDGLVVRPAAPWTPAVHALLRHLEHAGFDGAPRVAGTGCDAHGNETLHYIEGQSPQPLAWSDEGIAALGAMLRSLHDATASFVPPADAQWQDWVCRSDDGDAIIGHGDTGPWNVLARDGLPVALIDWEFAGPIQRLDEVASCAWLNAQLHDDDVAELNKLPSAQARAHQVRLFADGYGLTTSERTDFVTRMIDYAVQDCAHQAVIAGITQQSHDPEPLWGLAWRARSAAWMVRHRALLDDALGLIPRTTPDLTR